MASSEVRFGKSKRIVVKIGSSQVASDTGSQNRSWLINFAADLASCMRKGCEVVVVSSGAAALGASFLPIPRRRWRLEDRQAAAAMGQTQLMNVYAEVLAEHNIHVAQLLVTIKDTEERRTHLNARATLRRLLSCGIIPIVNENDSVSTEELRYGDNDRLAARVAIMIEADTFVILSDVDGLYDDDPRRNPNAKHIPQVGQITDNIYRKAKSSTNKMAHGGMVTKVAAAMLAQEAGVETILCLGNHKHPLLQIRDDANKMTVFQAYNTSRVHRKKWIAGSVHSAGMLKIDEGAQQALRSGKSLLAAGVTAVEGNFQRGDIVRVYDIKDQRVALGLVGYSSDECKQIIGSKSSEVIKILGRSTRTEVIHRDDLALA